MEYLSVNITDREMSYEFLSCDLIYHSKRVASGLVPLPIVAQSDHCLIAPGAHSYLITTADQKGGTQATVRPIKIGDTGRMKTLHFEFEATVLSINGERFEGAIVKRPIDSLPGEVSNLPLSHVWGRHAT